ncbi:C-_U-editing enzyme APOBEC-2b isoform X2 [Cynoglossus semilaevis]|uniref:Apolipoprotein B mRNA editing enzyme, catalytic polypeptide-like 2b n=2 Tax=Cynoglossus semilaevis TaxID=244447 RepID=A0A3P8UF11_CYNSE|nr:probable C->U-editing enzyme APOBEC-2 isoform X2 [Cynoglossus semilaevis]
MADRSNLLSVKKKNVEKKVEDKDKEKEKSLKKSKKPVNKTPQQEEKTVAGGQPDDAAAAATAAAGEAAEGANAEGNGDYQPIELPPFEIVSGERMSLFYFKFQFRNVEYSSGRNKTLLCYRVDTAGGSTEPLTGYMEDEHTTAHAEEAFFQQVLTNPSLDCDVTWYVSSSPCVACAEKLTHVLRQRKKLRLRILCSRLLQWEEPEIREGLRALNSAGCKLQIMKPSDFQLVWDTYVDKEAENFAAWEDCKENYEFYEEKLSEILQ